MELIWKLHSDPDNYITRWGGGILPTMWEPMEKYSSDSKCCLLIIRTPLLQVVWNIKAKNSLEIKLKSGDMTGLPKSQIHEVKLMEIARAAQLGLKI